MFTHAFILAAGMGSRLRPYTDDMPKPMVSVAGKPMIDHILDKLVLAGVTDVTINLHYKGEILKEHLSKRSDVHITFSCEEELLDTGGGIKKVIHTLGSKPFLVLNGDAFWGEKDKSIFETLYACWDNENMDVLLALFPVKHMHLTKGVGDYTLDVEGRAHRSKTQDGDMMFAGIRACHPRIFRDVHKKAFSFLELMDKAESCNRLYGVEHQGMWHHISTPEDLENVNGATDGA